MENALKLPVPFVDVAYYSKSEAEGMRALLDDIGSRYDKLLANVAKLTGCPADLLRAKIATESRGDARIISSAGAVGLCQIKPETAAAVLFIEVRGDKNRGLAARRLSAEERQIVVSYIGETAMKRIEACGNLGEVGKLKPSPVTAEQLKKPELNAILGGMALKQAIDLHQKEGVVRLDLVIADYGRGRGALRKVPDTAKTSPENFLRYIRGKSGWGEVATSIAKIGGRNGLLEIQRA